MKEFIDKLISRLEEYKIKRSDDSPYGIGVLNGYAEAISIVNELAEEYKGGWIPCERELPRLGSVCICSVNKKKYTDATHDIILCRYEELYADRWQDCFLAWMPLPAPYTEGE